MFKTISAALLATAMLTAPALAASTKTTVTAKPAATVGLATSAKPAMVKPVVKKVRHARTHRSHKMTASKHVARAVHHGRFSTAKAVKPMPVIKKKV